MKIKGIKFKREGLCHMALSNCHLMKDKITIIAPGNLVNGRVFYAETNTKKRAGEYGSFGKSTTYYYFEDTPKGKEFSDIKSLLASINIEIS